MHLLSTLQQAGLSVHHVLITLRDALAAEELLLVLWLTPTSFGFALAALEISKANLISCCSMVCPAIKKQMRWIS